MRKAVPLFVTAVLLPVIASMALFLLRKDPSFAALGALLAVTGTAAAVLYFRQARDRARFTADLEGPLSKAASRLGRGISTFASGDLRVNVEFPAGELKNPETRNLAEILRTVIADFNSTTAVPSKRICFTGANSY